MWNSIPASMGSLNNINQFKRYTINILLENINVKNGCMNVFDMWHVCLRCFAFHLCFIIYLLSFLVIFYYSIHCDFSYMPVWRSIKPLSTTCHAVFRFAFVHFAVRSILCDKQNWLIDWFLCVCGLLPEINMMYRITDWLIVFILV